MALNMEVSQELATMLDKAAETANATEQPLYAKAAIAVLRARARELDAASALNRCHEISMYAQADIDNGGATVESLRKVLVEIAKVAYGAQPIIE